MSTLTTDAPAAAGNDTQGNDLEQLQLVTFAIGDEEFGVDILVVQEINRMLQITQVPQSPPDVMGVINLRGRIIPVYDLRTRFGMPPADQNEESRIIVADVADHALGFIVDRVSEVLRMDRSVVEPAPQMASSIDSDYIEGVGKLEDRLLILLDLKRLFDVQTLSQIAEVTSQASSAA